MLRFVVCAASEGHDRSVVLIWPEAMLVSVACTAAWGYNDVLGLVEGPSGCPWPVLLPETMWTPQIHDVADYKGQESFSCRDYQ